MKTGKIDFIVLCLLCGATSYLVLSFIINVLTKGALK